MRPQRELGQRNRPTVGGSMTVCIAVRSEGMIILLSDRMITSGDIEFEPPTSKIIALTTSIGMMYSGDSSLFAEIAQELIADVRARIGEDPGHWLRVRDVAFLYAKHWNEARLRRADIDVLAPYGLTRKTYAQDVMKLDPKVSEKISSELEKYSVPTVEVIIAGIDLRYGVSAPAPSIYHVFEGSPMCADQAAFAAIGTGGRHAESQFMLAKYAGTVLNGEALLLAYSAKRDAEVAPGVGKETDVFVFGGNVGNFFKLPDILMKKLEDEYQKVRLKDAQVRKKARTEVTRYLGELQREAPKAQQVSPTAGTAIGTSEASG